jgi:hypothetical protein
VDEYERTFFRNTDDYPHEQNFIIIQCWVHGYHFLFIHLEMDDSTGTRARCSSFLFRLLIRVSEQTDKRSCGEKSFAADLSLHFEGIRKRRRFPEEFQKNCDCEEEEEEGYVFFVFQAAEAEDGGGTGASSEGLLAVVGHKDNGRRCAAS